MGLTLSSWTAVLARVRPYNCSKTQVWIRYFAKLKPLCKKNTVSLYNSHASQEGTFLCEQEVLLLRLCAIRLKNVLCFTPLGCCLFPYYYYYCMPSNNLTSQKANSSPEIVACTPLLIVKSTLQSLFAHYTSCSGFFLKIRKHQKKALCPLSQKYWDKFNPWSMQSKISVWLMGDASAYSSNEVPNLVYCINSITDAAKRDTVPIVSSLCQLNSIKTTPFHRSSSIQWGVSGTTLRVLHPHQKIDFKRGNRQRCCFTDLPLYFFTSIC